MKHKRLWILLGAVLTLSGALSVLMQSETAFVWLMTRAIKILPGEVSVQGVRGRLAGPMVIQGLRYQHQATLIYIGDLQLDWRPSRILTGKIDVTRLEVEQVDIQLAASDSPAAKAPLRIDLPFGISLSHTRLRNIRLQLASPPMVMLLPLIEVESHADADYLNIVAVTLELPTARVSISGQIGMQSPHPLELTTLWHWQTPQLLRLSGHGSVSGDLQQLKLSQTLQTPSAAQLTAVIEQPLDNLNWQAQLHIDKAKLRQWLTATTPDLQLTGKLLAEGGLDHFSWQGHFDAAGPTVGKIESELKGEYVAQSLQIELLTLHARKTHSRVSLRGNIDLHNSPTLAMEGDWQNLVWPLIGQAQLSSPKGACSLRGSLAQYHLKADAILQGPAIPPGHWRLAGTGQADGLKLDTLEGKLLAGEVTGSMALEWLPSLKWQLALNGQQLDPATFWPVQHGRLAGELRSQGYIKDGLVQMNARLDQLRGTLHEQAVTGAVRLQVSGEHYQLPQFKMSIGETHFNIRGQLSDVWDLHWQINSPDLTVVSPYTAGQFESEGRVSGARVTPRLRGSLHATKLAAGVYQATAVDTEFDVDLTGRRPSRLLGTASRIRLHDQWLDSLQIKADSLAQILSLDIQAQGEDLALTLHARGPLRAGRWHGELTRADFKSPRLAGWQLATPAKFSVARQNLRLDTACWIAGEAKFCLEIEQAAAGDWRIALVGKQVPLALGEWFVPPGVQFTGRVDGEAKLVLRDRQVTGQANWQLSPGGIVYATRRNAVVSLNYHGGNLQLALDDRGVSGDINLAIDQSNYLRLGVTLPGFKLTPTPDLSTQALAIQLQARFDQLTLLSLIFPELMHATGQFNADLRINGTAAQPRIEGYATLEQVGAVLPDLGITLQGLQLTARARNATTLQLTGQARSAKGDLQLSGEWQLDPAAGWPVQLSLHGKQFEILHTTEAWVLVSPDLTLRMANKRIDIEGKVMIPSAKLEPVALPEGVTVSRDTIITGAGTGEDASHYRSWEIYSKVRITLGDDVQFNGFGLRGQLTGEVLAVDTPQTLTTGRGELVIHHGRYRVHGEKLEVDPGRLVFAGGPIDDPGVDARAFRRLDEVVAGVQVRGTLKAPKLFLYSEPAMRESDILAYIVLGRPLDQTTRSEAGLLIGASSLLNFTESRGLNDQIASRFGLEEISIQPGATPEQGVSLVLGKYLSPRLYISYMVGLMDSVNTVRARYKLGRQVSLQGETSSTQSGADILYTIEQ